MVFFKLCHSLIDTNQYQNNDIISRNVIFSNFTSAFKIKYALLGFIFGCFLTTVIYILVI
jgi:hypothetical protein